MAQYIKQGDIFGRVGSGLAKGLSEQVPKEMERNRLATGLKNLGEQKNLSPFQQYAGLVGVAHDYPQVVQSGSDLLRQQAYLNSLQNQYEGGGPSSGSRGYVPTQEELDSPLKGEIPTLADEKSTQESYKNYIPPQEQEERRDAYENFQKNPARYGYQFDNALAERKSITQRNMERQKAFQEQEKIAIGKEDILKNALIKETQKLGLTDVQPEIYQKYEQKMIEAILPKKDGGEGLTQNEAAQKYSQEIRQIYRNNKDLESMSSWSAWDYNRLLDTLKNDFASRGDEQLLMDKLVADHHHSPEYAAYRAYGLSDKEKKALKSLEYRPSTTGLPGFPLKQFEYEKIKKAMGSSGSPLAIAYKLSKQGYNPTEWLDYLNNNRDHLEVWQADQLSKPHNIINLQDIWIEAWEKAK